MIGRSAAAPLVLAWLVLAAACTGAPGSTGSTAGTTTAGPTTTAGADFCDLLAHAGCATFLVRFDEARSLAELDEWWSGLPGLPIAVVRTDAVCIDDPGIDWSGAPGRDEVRVTRFAYVDGDVIGARRRAAIDAGAAPPPTNMGMSEEAWVIYARQWELAEVPGVEFLAAVVWVPREVGAELAAGAGVTSAAPVESYRTNSDAASGDVQVDPDAIEALVPPAGPAPDC